ncbi:2-oxoglutarate-Fe(II)-dependent oxygenase superfamily protein [Tenacibaculum gallaicum]|uniref:2-oxoglutarate-Fe(II)-dependent oxygenase superfamily protein n=1 Tax=Tenacibaculum gallaicum TaxID=561505 RepID=A0A3E0IC90_9FLAO|nr:alpha-ketoglutarate-dependent dioxygenase AlkB [Tenacibaculum gallaicum]REH56261.1 2-oxoglutarate-Fe(II)-dependent oxygenase superfamily protein [Tenacibaculum gallaicum]
MSTSLNNVISYSPNFLTKKEATKLFQQLTSFSELTNMMEMKLPSDEVIKYNFGKLMFVDSDLIKKNVFQKSAWGNVMKWPEYMLPIKKQIQEHTGLEFKTCVCIYYPDGNSGVNYHSDEMAFGDTDVIPSISLGEERMFYLRENKTMIESKILLEHGSLLVMEDGCQEYYEHSLPENPKYLNPRVNLTFRKYGF